MNPTAPAAQVRLRDYVWMKPAGNGPVERVSCLGGDTSEIEKRMIQGWSQVEEEPKAKPQIKGE